MKCTVLLPVYGGGTALAEAIESILRQDEAAFEFLIIDDHSPDGSADLVRRYAERDSRIRAICHDRNLGLAPTLNEGLAAARCDLVARMDQDDIALPARLAAQVSFMDKNPDVVVAGSFVYHMGRTPKRDRLVTLPVMHEDIVRELPKQNCIYHPSVIVRRNEILSLGGYRASYKNAEDYDLWLRVSKVYRVANIPIPLLRYRFSTNGMSLGRKWQQALFARMAVIAYLHPDWGHDEVERAAADELEQQGRGWFFEQVTRGTVRELMALGLWGDAWRVLSSFWRQMDRGRAWRLALELGPDLLLRRPRVR